jgi:hypothetical protein
VGGYFHGGGFHGKKDIPIRGHRISQSYLKKKNDKKLNKKTIFSTESKEQHQKLKRKEIIMCVIGFAP